MGLRSQIESAERRLNKVLPVVAPPTLKMNINMYLILFKMVS